ncbi:MAG: hypothetical protein QOE45_1179 [Frankiaceae bacterium]|jgi:hypothetical protein|nr:hypothetical protein [Frankiaceae bacterium]
MRKLNLKKETLAELSTSELVNVVGGATGRQSCAVKDCLGPQSDFAECLTGVRCIPTLDGCFTGTTTTN